MSEQSNNNVEKQTPFLKRVSELEKAVAELKKEKVCGCVKKIAEIDKEIGELKKQVKILIKVLKR